MRTHLIHPDRPYRYYPLLSRFDYIDRLTMSCAALKIAPSNDSAIYYVLPVLWMTSHVAYGEAYCRGMSVSARQRQEGRSFSAEAPPHSALPPADWWHSSTEIPRRIQRSSAV